MKKTILCKVLTIITIAWLIQLNTQAQDTIVQWTFPANDGTADDGVISSNLSRQIETAGGTSNIEFKNGATSKAARATGWDNGNDEKKWKVELETTGYGNLKLSSKISSGGENPGPRDFKVQYKINDGSWTDIENSNFQTANDWVTGVLFELNLPNECDSKSLIKIRWIMTSDTASDGTILNETGISKIDDIFITGQILNGEEELSVLSQISIYPNPATDIINFESELPIVAEIYNMNGEKLLTEEINGKESIHISQLKSGIYLVKMTDAKSNTYITRTIVKHK